MPVHYECTGYWRPPCDVHPGDVLDYDRDEGAMCPECGSRIDVLVETVSIQEVPVDA